MNIWHVGAQHMMEIDHPTLTVTVSLTKLERLYEKVRELTKNRNKVCGYVRETWGYIYPTSKQEFINDLLESQTKRQQDIQKYLELVEDRNILKQMIHATKIRKGIAVLLAKLNVLKQREQIWAQMNKDVKEETMIISNHDRLEAAFDHGIKGKGSFKMAIPVYTEKELETKILEVRKQIHRLEDQLEELSNKTKVSVKLHTNTMKLLGF